MVFKLSNINKTSIMKQSACSLNLFQPCRELPMLLSLYPRVKICQRRQRWKLIGGYSDKTQHIMYVHITQMCTALPRNQKVLYCLVDLP